MGKVHLIILIWGLFLVECNPVVSGLCYFVKVAVCVKLLISRDIYWDLPYQHPDSHWTGHVLLISKCSVFIVKYSIANIEDFSCFTVHVFYLACKTFQLFCEFSIQFCFNFLKIYYLIFQTLINVLRAIIF